MTESDIIQLRSAKQFLETPGLGIRLVNRLGVPIEKGFAALPDNWQKTVRTAVRVSLEKALDIAIASLRWKTPSTRSNFLSKFMVGASGGIGGAVGLTALPVELPVSTTIMLRAIGETAQRQGHSLESLETRLNCMEVFALGGRSQADDAAESAYLATRAALAKAVSDATSFIARRGVLDSGAPAIIRLINTVAARYGIAVSEQVAAKSVPVIGAATGSAINLVFIDHFQKTAEGHFIVKRLEKKYGTERVLDSYNSIDLEQPTTQRNRL
ncbi:MAG: EcsC family protein [Verrucomicrobia bacterium]|nr:EcsC family protein [Verrucomicrobiota bacterium]